MALKEFRPLTPTLRFKSLPAFDEITKWRPERSLLESKKKTGGRNNYGRLTSRHIGGGHKQKYRKVDFKRRKRGVPAEVVGDRVRSEPLRSPCSHQIRRWRTELHSCAKRTSSGIDRLPPEMTLRLNWEMRCRFALSLSALTFTTSN